ncbi:uncharacterized protein LOC143849440 [Tasmannia lanceolata]|uniref:uncharacterized protein LOC143849440 n=1 Tax=Tasmannia lanceolata TaxID=3420 RepID=UPI0040628AB7
MRNKNSPSSVNGHYQKSDNASPGCLSRIFRCLLCSNHSSRSSNCKEETNENLSSAYFLDKKREDKTMTPPSPSIVARLMGLESMPVELGRIPKPNSIGRSRSVNSLSWSEFDPLQRQHRRVRTSLSFREIPTFLRQENEEFLILSFGSDEREELAALGPKKLRSQMVFRELKEKRAETSKSTMKETRKETRPAKRKDQERSYGKKNVLERRIVERRSRKSSNCSEIKGPIYKKQIGRKPHRVMKAEKLSKPLSYKGISDGAKFSKNTKEDSSDKKVESECSSENSSPVSVLDQPFDMDSDLLIDPQTLTSVAGEDSRPSPSYSRRKLSNFDYPSSCVGCSSTSGDRELETINEECEEPSKSKYQPLDYSELWGMICRLSDEDVKKSNRVETWKVEDAEEIGIEFGLQILERLVHEAVAEFSENMFAI